MDRQTMLDNAKRKTKYTPVIMGVLSAVLILTSDGHALALVILLVTATFRMIYTMESVVNEAVTELYMTKKSPHQPTKPTEEE